MPRAQLLSRARLQRGIVGACGAAALAAFAYTNGGYSATTQEYALIVVWWILGFFAAVGVHGTGYRLDRTGRATLVLLAALTVWTALSAFWAQDAERAYAGFIRLALYFGAVVLAVAAARFCRRAALVTALALAVVAITGASFAGQLFPHAFGVAAGGSGIAANARLSFPLGYWNGVGVFAALGYPLLVGLAASSRRTIGTAAALAPFPLLAAVVYLTSSRGGVATAAIGTVATIAADDRRWRTCLAALVAAVGSGLGVLVAHPHGTLTHGVGPAFAILGCAAVTAGVGAGVRTVAMRLPAPSRIVGWALTAVVVLAVVAAAAAAHPVARLEAFKAMPRIPPTANPDYVSAHLLSTSGSGRWQFWGSAIGEFKAHPVGGGGAGSFAAWWTQHRPIRLSVVDVHSAYLEALAELGLIGFVLLTGGMLTGVAAAFLQARRGNAPDELGGALAGCFLGFAFAAAIDWMWELPGVTLVALVALGLALAPGEPKGREPYGGLTIARASLATAAVVVMVAAVIPLLSHIHLHASYARASGGDLAAAEEQALDAHALQPWAASPYTQLALVSEQRGDLQGAEHWIGRAIARAPEDWRLHLVAARLDTKLAQIPQARAELATVRRLNPFAALPGASG